MNYKNKYEAAKDYNLGVKLALFYEKPAGFLWKDWEKQSYLFKCGYAFGKSLKELMLHDRNAHLANLGIDPINVISAQASENPVAREVGIRERNEQKS